MKNFAIIMILLLLIIGCTSEQNNDKSGEYYIEKELSFFKPQELTYSNGKYKGYVYETWIRQPENLKLVHETLKKIGYKNLFSLDREESSSNHCSVWGIHIKRPCSHIIDSLIITYTLDAIETKYYREFWQRRKRENNDEIIFEILQEISKILLKNEIVTYDENFVNDTLYNLVRIKLRQNPTTQEAYQDFEYLKTIGMHGSAYNLLDDYDHYYDIDWNREELIKQLKTDTQRCCPQIWIIDNTK